ncbi:hypothetical protein [Flavobacterium sp.]|uniref:hypothetical protein n=1 Tax=Flavobacterium sp. TaxID=239 RepID=UPI004034204D
MQYLEIYFSCCFYEVFPDENSSWETNLDGSEIPALLEILAIPFDKHIVSKKYHGSNDVEVFHSDNDKKVFAYFDLQKHEDDQNDMFFFGLRLDIDNEPEVFPKLLSLYKRLMTCSALSYDRFNRVLYNNVFQTNFYFYKNNYRSNGRKLNHHNFVQSAE